MDPDRHETQFRLMAKNLTEAVLAYNLERRLTFANAAAESLTGYSIAELERSEFACWVHPEDRQRMAAEWDRLFEGKSFHEERYRMVTRDGRLRWVSGSWGPLIDDSGAQVGVQGREHDVSARVMAEETQRASGHRLADNEEHYRTLFENSPFPMWEEDFSEMKRFLDGLRAAGVEDLKAHFTAHRESLIECVGLLRVGDVNRAAREFFGASSTEELIRRVPEIMDETVYDVFCDEIVALAGGSTVYQAEFPLRTLRGEERTVSMIVSLVAAPAADWSRVIISAFDVTDRKRLEEKFLQSQKLESLGRLAGGIAHDFNNLLTVINGYSDLLLRGIAAGHPMYEGLMQVRNAGRRGADLTQQLLAFSRKQVVQLKPLSLNTVVRESEAMLKRAIGENIRLRLDLDADTGLVKADAGQMHQVLMNLVFNARDAMPEGGVLTISTANADEGPRQFAMLRIRDTGVGIDPETRRHLFEPFYTTKRSGMGTGLGLSSVFGIVTQSGGRISVRSDPGEGAEFTVLLPRTSGAPAPAPLKQAERKASDKRGLILVVEDQHEVRGLSCAVLRSSGYQVMEASDGLEAILLTKELVQPVTLLLTDVIMPGINGRELAAGMLLTYPEIKVIYMSGYADQIINDSDGVNGPVEFLQKPFTPDQLVDRVRQVLARD